MALKYTTIDKLNTYLGTSGVDSLITQIGESAEALLDTLIGDGIESKQHTEVFKVWYSANICNEGRVFYLGATNPTQVTSVNGISAGVIDTNYTLNGTCLEFANAWNIPSAFPFQYKIIYTAGFATIPKDVELAVHTITSAIYSTRNAGGIASFKQDLLSVNYKDASILDTLLDKETAGIIQAIVNKYSVFNVLS